MDFPLAYFLSWTGYGTRLHGDPRGTVDLEHNRFGDPVLRADAARQGFERRVMKGEAVVLTDPMRRVVRDTIVEDCRHRGARLIALNVRSSHVHVVVSAAMDPGKLAGHFKSWSTRRLREAGLAGDTAVWTTYSSTRYLWKPESLGRAVRYTLEEQGAVDEFVVGPGAWPDAPASV